ncbi:Phytochrome-like protein cph2 [Marinomonas spartinae]|uniref:Phytochrome-like protein cph2 n=1 Tax=Marinomonas spartinae TaxID=1792290 RepID=A0A1A8TQY9_9GAMM|nr:EAL domain-containing protein [Marinomonas spartinae]SBS32749.1 Phytochrome-like protein cph2 [Marinomonas spartinae]SBS35598.1 Phytochrome-like protein cph2 [Marinomonas spartinae]
MGRLSRSLFVKQAVLTLTLAVVLSLLSSFFQVLEGVSAEKKNINRFFGDILTIVENPIAEATFRLDKTLIKQQIDSLLLNSNVARVEVKDEAGEVFVFGQSSQTHFPVSKSVADFLFPDLHSYHRSLILRKPYFKAGQLIIWPEKRVLAESFLIKHASILMYNLVKDLLFAFIISVFFYFLITHPLERLTQVFTSIEEDLDRPFPDIFSRRHRFDEFGRLYVSFARLWQKLKHTKDELERSYIHSMAVIEHAADGILLLDQEFKVVFLNTAARAMLGEQASVTLNQSAQKVLDDETFNTIKHHIDTMPPDTPLTLETLFKGAKKAIPVEIHLAQFDLQGKVEILLLVRDVTERIEAQEHIHQLAYYDPLTKLPNRQLLIDKIDDYLKHDIHEGQFGALILIDLDRFSTINDALGHNVGDKLLVRVSEELSLLERESIILARMGGDEFAFFVMGMDKQTEVEGFIKAFAQKVLVLCATSQEIDQHSMHISASIGVMLFSGQNWQVETIVKQADTALYRAKEAGRNTYVIYENTMQAISDLRLEKEKSLHRAIELGLFELYYQPQVNNLGELIGAEALIRWDDGERGFISPSEFIPLAEELGLIVDIGSWVMDTAFSQVSTWLEDGIWLPSWRMSINVSPVQFQQYGFLAMLKEKIDKYQLPTCCVDLEITENMLLTDLDSSLEKMKLIREMGVHLSVDDFGTGYSSLKYLKILPINRLKIDQSFVRDLLDDKGDEAIVFSIIALSKAFNVSVLAEGVESVAQFERLQEIGCYFYQGYLFSRPVSSSQFVNECVHGLKMN